MPSNSSSSSSSEEEDDLRAQQLREATVTFENLDKANKKAKASKIEPEKAKKSKRVQDFGEDDNNVCDVTPEFQEFVAKKLKNKIDESIELVSGNPKKIKNKKSKSSNEIDQKFEIVKNIYYEKNENLLKEKPIQIKKNNVKKSKICKDSSSDSDDDSHMRMLKEAAVGLDFLAKTTCINKHKTEFLSVQK